MTLNNFKYKSLNGVYYYILNTTIIIIIIFYCCHAKMLSAKTIVIEGIIDVFDDDGS